MLKPLAVQFMPARVKNALITSVNNSPKIDWSKAKLNEDCRNTGYKFEVKAPDECKHDWKLKSMLPGVGKGYVCVKCQKCGEFYRYTN